LLFKTPRVKTAFIIDDHIAFRTGLRMMLEKIPGLAVVNDCTSSSNLIPEIRSTGADIVFLDVHLRKTNSFDLTRHLRKLFPEVKIIMLSMFSEPGYLTDGKNAGADAVVLKSSVSFSVVRLLREFFPGEFACEEKSLN
jgi:DNA-binding NarL/FixJ family response regulator